MTIISFCNDDHAFSWNDEEEVSHWLIQVASTEGHTIKELTYVYCSDQRLLEINQQFLKHDYFTDIITFDLSESDDLEGEVYISLDRVRENAMNFGTSVEHELCRVHVHGILHLMGYNDHTQPEKQIMRQKEDLYLSLLSEVPRGAF